MQQLFAPKSTHIVAFQFQRLYLKMINMEILGFLIRKAALMRYEVS